MKSATIAILLSVSTLSCTSQPDFMETTEQRGIQSNPTWKYGGPALADLNNDGRLDLLLGNHHEQAAQFFLATATGYSEQAPIMQWDVHGIAAGDFDADGWVDLAIAMGGGNGTNPQPPRLLRNVGGTFEDVTEQAGIAHMGARGRSVRWLDADADGDLDLLQINAVQLPGEPSPRNILFLNDGNGKFSYHPAGALEQTEAERILVTWLNGDAYPDLITFTPLKVWHGQADATFKESSAQWLHDLDASDLEHAMAIAEADIDGDGDMDLYIARGKTYYEIANNAVDFNRDTGRLDLRDEGNKSSDAIEFSANSSIQLLDFFHWPRGKDIALPVFIGENRTEKGAPSQGLTVSPDEAQGSAANSGASGWYLTYLGGQRWRLRWVLQDNLAWDIRASILGVSEVHPQWEPQLLDVQDLLLINQGSTFSNASHRLPLESAGNHWGVISGDFANRGQQDFFVYRFGKLQERIPDLLIRRSGKNWRSITAHGATHLGTRAHGDMGAAFDSNSDGRLDILSGDDDQGRWHLFENQTAEAASLTLWVGYSPAGIDPHGAEVWVTTNKGRQYQRVGDNTAVHSQSLKQQLHFGFGDAVLKRVDVRWRNGEHQTAEPDESTRALILGRQTKISPTPAMRSGNQTDQEN